MAFCTSCGTKNDDSAKFCINCGFALQSSSNINNIQNTSQPPQKTDTLHPNDSSGQATLIINSLSILGGSISKCKLFINDVEQPNEFKFGDVLNFQIATGITNVYAKCTQLGLPSTSNTITIDVTAGNTYTIEYGPNAFNTGFVLKSKDGVSSSKPNYLTWALTGGLLLMWIIMSIRK